MSLLLKVFPHRERSFNWEPESDSFVFGRSTQADLTVPDPSISRKHARFFFKSDAWFVEDLGSHNGSAVDGSRVLTATPIRKGQTLKFGNCRVVVSEAEEETVPYDSDLGGSSILLDATEFLKSDLAPQDEDTKITPEARYTERLRILNEIHHALGRSIAIDELLDMILESVFRHLNSEEGAIYLKDERDQLRIAASRSLFAGRRNFTFSRKLETEVIEKGMAALVYDAEHDKRFSSSMSIVGAGIRSLVAAPLLSGDTTLGMIVLSSRAAIRQFTEADLQLLVSMASVAGLRLVNLRLAEEAAERRRMEAELSLARQIQIGLIPSKLPEIDGYRIYAENQASRGVSGDYYQVLQRKDNQECVIMIADVSGKGMGASLLMASLEALAAAPIEDGLEPHEICRKLSDMLYRRTTAERYATLFLSTLHVESNTVTYTNAGHNPSILVKHDGSTTMLENTGFPVGMFPRGKWTQERIHMEPGDTLVLYTDGITEITNKAKDEYGRYQLAEFCAQHRRLELPELAEKIHEDLDRFAEGEPNTDDQTLVLLRRT